MWFSEQVAALKQQLDYEQGERVRAQADAEAKAKFSQEQAARASRAELAASYLAEELQKMIQATRAEAEAAKASAAAADAAAAACSAKADALEAEAERAREHLRAAQQALTPTRAELPLRGYAAGEVLAWSRRNAEADGAVSE